MDDFDGATTLLIWGDNAGMLSLLECLSGIVEGVSEVVVGEDQNTVTVSVVAQAVRSHVSVSGGLRWECSNDTLRRAGDLIGPLLQASGHQYLDADGEAEQVMISANEYPADLRP
ncbi:hypothetical protein [Brevundimonas sp.]|uniref:hypothetical protein n=1 Tax=Brevundimonas sp. TaxID=1871086 RepID=UPI0035643541